MVQDNVEVAVPSAGMSHFGLPADLPLFIDGRGGAAGAAASPGSVLAAPNALDDGRNSVAAFLAIGNVPPVACIGKWEVRV